MNVTAEAPARSRLADGTGAVLIALIYGIAGPVIGAVLIVPIATIATAEFRSSTLAESLLLVLGAFPITFPVAYLLAGTLALATGVIVAAAAHRHGRVSVWLAVAAPTAVFLVLALLERLTGLAVPGAGLVRTPGSLGMLIWLVICIAASLVCWLITLPIQRRMR